MRSFKKIKSDLGNGSHSVTGAIPDVTTRVTPDAAPQANTDEGPQRNPDSTEKPGETTDSSGTFDWG